MSGLDSPDTWALFFNNLLHGACGYIHINVTKFAPIDHNDFFRFFLCHIYPLDELTFQFMAVLVEPGFGVVDFLRVKKSFLFQMIKFQVHGTTGNNCNI